ncbi:MAG: dynamin family protein, partial [Microbacterium sp.]|uniref:dynamin family protein n=1 Tax=Microbacterium sp. TaxID=51671 RepID=UPI00263998CD
MSRVRTSDVTSVVDAARAHYADDRIAQRMLDEFDLRLREPVRIAVAGMVKAGKSTLLNALIGEAIAPTDAGECTRAVTWYRHAHTPGITAQLRDGTQRRLPIGRIGGRIDLDAARLSADDVERIDVGWPAEALRANILIDTPGVGSLSPSTSERSTRFLASPETSPDADAVIYLLRHLHATDLSFLESFRDAGGHSIRTISAIAVLSRADEIGSGRIDSMLSASRIADRYRRDGEMRALTLGTIPIAGLLAEGGRTLREEEFDVFRR